LQARAVFFGDTSSSSEFSVASLLIIIIHKNQLDLEDFYAFELNNTYTCDYKNNLIDFD
jgi:hypothetical protein